MCVCIACETRGEKKCPKGWLKTSVRIKCIAIREEEKKKKKKRENEEEKKENSYCSLMKFGF